MEIRRHDDDDDDDEDNSITNGICLKDEFIQEKKRMKYVYMYLLTTAIAYTTNWMLNVVFTVSESVPKQRVHYIERLERMIDVLHSRICLSEFWYVFVLWIDSRFYFSQSLAILVPNIYPISLIPSVCRHHKLLSHISVFVCFWSYRKSAYVTQIFKHHPSSVYGEPSFRCLRYLGPRAHIPNNNKWVL